MAHDCPISHAVKLAQETMFREAQRRGMTLKAISLDSDIPYSTLRSYAGNNGATAEMCVSAIRKLHGVLSDDLLSLLTGDGVQIITASDEIDHDSLSEVVRDYLDTKEKAHRADSPAGPAICPTKEKPILDAKATGLKAVGA